MEALLSDEIKFCVEPCRDIAIETFQGFWILRVSIEFGQNFMQI